MTSSFFASLFAHYHWQATIATAVAIAVVSLLTRQVESMVPTLRAARQLNTDAYMKKMEKPSYAANHAWNRKWSGLYVLVIFLVLLPFSVTLQAQPLWKIALDAVVILMVYDFFYYLMHRFLFHDSGFMGGPLKWMHAIHHRQHNPCERDGSYIHPLEIALGLGLYAVTAFILARVMGDFHVATITLTWMAFSKINVHNHALWTESRFPYRYMSYISRMHHNHHARFTGGNFATISLLFDWMFGTLDNGDGYKREPKALVVRPVGEGRTRA